MLIKINPCNRNRIREYTVHFRCMFGRKSEKHSIVVRAAANE